ncbi:MAG TPA: NAD(P)-dependent oxidoreductase [Acidimicrobiia bacterium]|nr:NAD(P)-dependent oxidoreductase [Acidimicrobiia bacterium]
MTSQPPKALLFDPITWLHDWSYEVERTVLAGHGVELVSPADRTERDALLPSADVVVVSSIDQLSADRVGRLDRCVGILCYSAGMDAVDQAAAAAAGIPVRNIRAGTADVADHAMTLVLAAWRRLPQMTAAARAGSWDLGDHPHFRSIPRLAGRTLGILGAGAIGKEVAQRARAFGLKTIATYRRPTMATEELAHVPIEELFATADVVVLTAALTPETRGIVDRRALGRARPGTILVNVGRGGLIVEEDLEAALDEGIIGAAALDVRATEPPDSETDRLTHRPDVIQTPHMAGVSSDALEDLHALAAEEIIALLTDGGRL